MGRFVSILAIPFGIVLLLATSPTSAREFELTPLAGYRWGGQVDGGDSADLEGSAAPGLSFGWRLRTETWFEIVWSHQESEFALAPFSAPGQTFGIDVDYLHFAGVYRPERPDGRPEPFVTFSAGLTHLDAEEPGFGRDEGLSLAIGGGTTFPLGANVGLRLAARAWFTLVDTQFSGLCGGTACSFELSGDGAAQADVTLGIVFRLGSPAGGA
jgi:hypothetical protein